MIRPSRDLKGGDKERKCNTGGDRKIFSGLFIRAGEVHGLHFLSNDK